MYTSVEICNDIELVDFRNTDIVPIEHITIVKCSDVTYPEFFSKYLRKNKPCIITDVSSGWPCKAQWTTPNDIDFEQFVKCYGEYIVPVADCSSKFYNSQRKIEMKMSQYIQYWISYRCRNYPSEMPLQYLKDWHFKKEFPLENIYNVPIYFCSDWLNEYAVSNNKDDYMFVYMGPKGTWTPFHVDVFTSFSWSVNVVGVKRWLLFPPGAENQLRDLYGNLPYDVTECEKFKTCDVKYFEVLQKSGDAIFVPSGWYHQVWNMEDTISVNHNWINGCNVGSMWKALKSNLDKVKQEINDCRDMENWTEHCQLMLNATFGINYLGFYEFLKFIALKRLNLLNNINPTILFKKFSLGKYHAEFDLNCALNVLKNVIEEIKSECITFNVGKDLPPELLTKLKKCD